MDLMTHTLAGLVTEMTTPAFGPYSAHKVSLDSVLDQLVSSTMAVSQSVDGYGNPQSVAELISSRIGVGFGATDGTLFVFHHGELFAASGVMVGVNESVVQFADEHKKLHTFPLGRVVALIAS